MAEARTPEYIRKMPQFQETQRKASEATIASRAAVEVTDEASCAQAAEILSRVATAVKAGNKARLDASKPYRDSTDLINKEFKELLAPLEGAEERLRDEVANFEAKRRVEAEEAQRRHAKEVADHEAAVEKAADEAQAKREADEEAARKAAEAGQAPAAAPEPASEPQPVPPPPPPPPPVAQSGKRQTSGGSVTTELEWKFELVDLAMVPNDLKMLDDKEVRKRIAAGVREINGLRIYSKPKTVVR